MSVRVIPRHTGEAVQDIRDLFPESQSGRSGTTQPLMRRSKTYVQRCRRGREIRRSQMCNGAPRASTLRFSKACSVSLQSVVFVVIGVGNVTRVQCRTELFSMKAIADAIVKATNKGTSNRSNAARISSQSTISLLSLFGPMKCVNYC